MTTFVFARGVQYGKLLSWPEDERLAEVWQRKIEKLLEAYDPTLIWFPELSEVWGVVGETTADPDEFSQWWQNDDFCRAWEEAVNEIE